MSAAETPVPRRTPEQDQVCEPGGIPPSTQAESTLAELATVGLQVMPWVDMQDVDPIVAQVLGHIQAQTDVRYEVGAMETVLTGPLDRVLDVVAECLRIAHRAGAGEVLGIAKILYQPTGKGCRLP